MPTLHMAERINTCTPRVKNGAEDVVTKRPAGLLGGPAIREASISSAVNSKCCGNLTSKPVLSAIVGLSQVVDAHAP